MNISITQKLFLKRPHLTGEYDVASYLELPAKDLFDLRYQPSSEDLAYFFSSIFKDLAVLEYVTRIDNALNENEKLRLNYLSDNPSDTKLVYMHSSYKNVLSSPSNYDRAEQWYKNDFIPKVLDSFPSAPDAKFAIEFDKVLERIMCLRKRCYKLSQMKKKCFFSYKKKKRIEKLIDDIRCYLSDNSVGIYAILLYGFTIYSERSSNVLMFKWYLQHNN